MELTVASARWDDPVPAAFARNPGSAEMAQWFCSTISTMFGSLAYAVDRVNVPLRHQQLAAREGLGLHPR
jgi:hypothetical protein